MASPAQGYQITGGGDILAADEVGFTDAVAAPTAAGRLRRNAAYLAWHNSVSTYNLALETAINAANYSGATFGARLAAAISAASTDGAVIDCRAFTGAQTISATVTVDRECMILFGECTITVSAFPGIDIISNSVSLVGAGMQTTLIRAAGGASNAPIIRSSGSRTTVRDLQIGYTSGNAANICLAFSPSVATAENLVDRVAFAGTGAVGIGLQLNTQVVTSTIRGCRFDSFGFGIDVPSGTSNGNAVVVDGCHFESNARGLRMAAADDFHVHGSVFEVSTTENVQLVSGTAFFHQCHLENGTTRNVQVDAGSHYFNQCIFGVSATNQAVVNAGTGIVYIRDSSLFRGTTNSSTGRIILQDNVRSLAAVSGTTRFISGNRSVNDATTLAATTDASTVWKVFGYTNHQFGGDEGTIGSVSEMLTIITGQTGVTGDRAKAIAFLNSSGSAIGEIGGLGRCQFGNLELIPKLSDTPTNILDCQDGAANIVLRARRDNRRVAVGTGSPSADFSIVQVLQTATNQNIFNVLGAAHTTLAASTEAIDINIDLARTVQFATGALTLQRAFIIQRPTYGFVGASTVTDATTFSIDGSPLAGTNATLTRRWIATLGTLEATVITPIAGVGIFNSGTVDLVIRNTTNDVEGFITAVTGTVRMGAATNSSLDLYTNNLSRLSLAAIGDLTFTPGAASSGSLSHFTYTGPADTSLAASTEAIGINYNASATRQWATGALATQREFVFQAPTYGFVAASTLTDAVTFSVTGSPIAGTNATLTRRWAATFGTLEATVVTPTAGIGCFNAGTVDLVVRDTTNNVEGFFTAASGGITTGASTNNSLALYTNNASRLSLAAIGDLTLTPGASSSGAPTHITYTGPADTGLTASTEAVGVDVNTSATRQWATGALTTQRETVFRAPTYGFVAASTLSDAATVAITAAPVAGTNATLTRSMALWVQGGYGRFDGGLSIGASFDTRLERDAAYTLALRNGTNAQAFRVFNTYTSDTNYEGFGINWVGTGNTCVLQTIIGASGTDRTLQIRYGGASSVAIQVPASSAAGEVDIGPSITSTATITGLCRIGNSASLNRTLTNTCVYLNVNGSYAPASASTMLAYAVQFIPTFNYIGAGAGTARCLYINPTNTALPTGTNAAIALSTAASTLGGVHLYNTADEATNYDRLRIQFASNIAEVASEAAGTGTARTLDLLSTLGVREQMGAGTGRAPLVGKANVNTTGVGNVGIGEDDLITYAMPASSLNASGKGVEIQAWGTAANNANVKTLKLYFGTQVILTNSITASQVGTWNIIARVFSTGTDTQDWSAAFTNAGTTSTIDNEVGTSIQDDGAAITIKCTGEATADNDIVQDGLLVKYIG